MTADILLVDDNAVQANTRMAILSRSGKDVAVANDAQQALDMLAHRDLSASIGLIVTDHLMPGMNGPEFIATLRNFLPQVPVVVLSGLPDAESEYQGLDVIFRLKPFAPDQLIQLAQTLLKTPFTRTA